MSWLLTAAVLFASTLRSMMPVGTLDLTLEDSPQLVGTLYLELEDSPQVEGIPDRAPEDVLGETSSSRVGTLRLELEDAPEPAAMSVPVGSLGLSLEGDGP